PELQRRFRPGGARVSRGDGSLPRCHHAAGLPALSARKDGRAGVCAAPLWLHQPRGLSERQALHSDPPADGRRSQPCRSGSGRAELARAVLSMGDFVLGRGQPWSFAAETARRQASDKVYYTVVRDGRFVALGDGEWEAWSKP